ncbi:DUF2142 domain-containing protein [Frondihabitans sp. PhB188]|uniref:glycosyltransferase family 39 protein n=1 Tax=Frondihabitans sp. PhB188 TaxID=2485200 RepID=UPI001315A72C|nr:DUF2142 domain-containing protein [Frondihabitans sp. PhB188]
MTDPTRRSRPEHTGVPAPLLRRMPFAVWAAVGLFVMTMTLWTVAMPTYRPADEYDHVSAVLSWEEDHEWPGFKELRLQDSVVESLEISGLRTSTPPIVIRPSLSVDNATARPERPTFDELGSGTVPKIDKAGQHPPLYYILLGSIASILPGWMSWDLEVWVFRIVSVILMAPLPLLAAALARRLGAGPKLTSAAAFSLLAVPQLAVGGGAVNNDNLLNAAGAWLALGTALVLTGDLRKRTALWMGLVSAVALLTKAWSLPLFAVVCLIYVVSTVRTRSIRRGATALALFVCASALGGWWWVRNYLIYGAVQPAGHHSSLDTPLSSNATVALVKEQFLEVFPTRFWSMLSIKYGLNAFPLWVPAVLSVTLLGTFALTLLLSPAVGVRRSDVALLLLPAG